MFSKQENYLYDSFETISSTGKNGAIIHYKYFHLNWKNLLVFFCFIEKKRPTKESDTKISKDELYLVDSGGQYK